jgi:hypothetical protein
LRIAVLDVALPLGAHDVIGEAGDTRGWWRAHDGGYRGIIGGGPTDQRQIKVRIGRGPKIGKMTDAGIEVENGHRTDAVVISNCQSVG